MSTFVYLVGDESSPKTNQWLAMCASPEVAREFAESLTDVAVVTHKTVEVKSPRRRKRGRK